MSVTKIEYPIKGPHGSKDRIWSLENLSMWMMKLVWDISLFFIFLYIWETEFNVRSNIFMFFIFIFINYIVSGVLAFFLSYFTVKLLFGRFLKRRVKPLLIMMKGKRRMKKFWIFVFTILFQAIFFVLSVNMILADKIPLVDSLAYFLAWIILWFVSRVLGRVLYFIFYTW